MSARTDLLRHLSSDPSNALELGRAGEHLVVADLISQGKRAFLTDQGLPYDIVLDHDGRLFRVQVKTACFPRDVNAAGRAERIAYSWAVRVVGKSGKKRLSDAHCDLVALVALDVKRIAYVPVFACSQTVSLRLDPEPGCWGFTLSEFESIEPALNGKPRSLALKGRRSAIRRNGQLTLLAGGME